jgi:hypothetical protein
MGAPLSLARSSLLLTVSIVSASLLLVPVALGRDGANGPAGILAAAAIILATGTLVELLGFLLQGSHSVAPALLGMAIRMLPPLAVCAMLAAKGAHGRAYLPFIGYLLTLYLVALAVETWLAVRRNAEPPVNSVQQAR